MRNRADSPQLSVQFLVSFHLNAMLLLKSLLLFFLVILTAFVALPLGVLFFSNSFLTFEIGFYRFLGFLAIGIGLVLTLWTVLAFVSIGKGTPAPFDPPKELVTEGLFKYVRNPMYIGAVVAMCGEAVLLESFAILFLAGLMWLLFHLFVVYYEEPRLKKTFGQSYEEYICTVPRWVPKIFHKS
jgi:protein-S-isoprenylcysteine O-methyltransferase Ste14